MHATHVDTPSEIAPLLAPGERVAWTGRPLRRVLAPDEAFKLPVAAALAVVGWILLNRREPIVLRNAAIPYYVFGLLMLFGAYYGTVRPWLAWRVRTRTVYAVTDRRALIIEPGRYAASYFLDPALKPELKVRRDGSIGTIRFVPERRGEQDWSLRPDRLKTFADVEDAGHVHDLVRALCDRHSAGVADVGTDVPYARRVNPERDVDVTGLTRPTPDVPLTYAEPIREKLKRGERTLFVARPPRGILLHTMDWFIAPIGLMLTAIGLGFIRTGLSTGCSLIIGLVILYCGYHLLFGRLLDNARQRRRTWYTVTDRRCLVVIEGKIVETKSVYWNFIVGMVRQHHGDGTATIYFELTPEARKEMPGEDGSIGQLPGVYFERLDDPAAVEALVIANVAGA